jgi:hypothetical protein
MSKSRARLLAELLNSSGLVKKSKSALSGADEVIDLSALPTITNAKLENASITIADHVTALGGSVTLNTGDIGEHTNYKYYTDARADARIAAADTGDLSEGSNLYFTNARADARIVNAGSANWNTAYGWGNHASAGYLTSYTDTNTHTHLDANDNRTIAPSEFNASDLYFGFTSWANNNTSPYADYLHMRSYSDSSGGADNMVMFKKSGIGMRLWQQTFGSSTNYSNYEDVWHTGNLTTTNKANYDTAYGWGNHASAGYVTSSGNTVIGTDTDLSFSGANVLSTIALTDGVITSYTNRVLTLANLGYTGETNATADQSAAEILTAIKTVDGSGSGLDADTIDGIDSSRIIYGSNASGTGEGTFTNWNSPTKSGFYSDDAASNKWSTANWSSIIHHKLYDDNNSYATQLGFDTYNNNLYTRTNSGGTWTSWDKIWHAGVDGSGSGLDADLLDGQHGSYYYSSANPPPTYSKYLRADVSDVYNGRVLSFGTAGNGTNTSGAFLTIEGNTDSSGEGSGRLFFREHNSSTAAADNYGMSLGYRGGATSVTTARGNTWTGLTAIGNGEWGMWGHDGDQTGVLAMHGPRTGSYVDFNNAKIAGNQVWHAGNDGSGSGLDADLLDGQHGSYYRAYANLTGTPTIPSLSGYATESYVGTQISNLVDSSPAALNTLNELAAAIGDDANFSTTVTNNIATKLPKAGGTMTGNLIIDYSGNATNDAGLYIANDNSDWGIYVNKDGTGTYGIKIAADGEYPFQITNSSGTEKFRVNNSGNVILAGTVDGRDVSADGTKLDTIATSANNYSFPYTVSASESNSTVVQRHPSGYIYANYYNGSGTFSTSGNASGMALFTGTNGSDTFGRPYTAAAARTLLNVENGATADQTAAEILTAIKTVDGSGSGLDADNLDGVTWASQTKAVAARNLTIEAGDGQGIGFWGGTGTVLGGSYAIAMSSQGNGNAGRMNFETTSDYNMYFKMSGGTNRGFVFKNGTSKVLNIDGSGHLRANSVISSNNRQAMNCVHWSASGTSTGAVKITLPGTYNTVHSMPIIKIYTYQYSSTAHVVYTISGHNWSTGSNWYNNRVTAEGGLPLAVRLGHDGTNYCIIIGETNTSWSYGSATVELKAHPSYYNANQNFTSGWTATQITSMPSTVTTQTVGKIWDSSSDGSGSGLDADLLDGQHGSYYAPATGGSYLPLAGGTITGNLNVNGTTTLGNGPSDQTHINDTLYLGATDSGDSHFYFGENSSNWYGDHWYWDSGHEVERYSRHAGTDTLIEKHNTQYTHKVQTNRAYERLGHSTGYQIGSYNSVAANSAKTNPIYTIGDSYRPSDTSVSGMYGIGYAHSNLWGTGSGKTSGWGQYVVENGAYTQIFSVGGTWSLGEYNRNGNKVWDAGNDGGGSGLDADLLDGQHGSYYAPASHVHSYMPTSFLDSAKITFTVGGDADTYYPVSIQGGGTFAYQMYSISRHYAATAPSTWNTSSHKGGLTLTWQFSGDGFWGGNDHDIRIIKFDENYSTMVTKMGGSVGGGGTNAGVVVWLRGGTASYTFHGPRGSVGDVNVHLTSVTASNGTVFAPMSYSSSDVASTINVRYPVRNQSDLYVSNNGVWHTGNDGSGSSLDADLLDGQQGSYYYAASNPNGYTNDQTAAEILTAIKTVDGSGSGLDADTVDGLHVGDASNNVANRLVRTEGNGYISSNYFYTSSNNNGTTAIARIYASQDGYIRYYTPTNFRTNLGLWWSGNDGSGSGLDADLLDGLNSTAFIRSDTGTIPAARMPTVLPTAGNYAWSNSTTAGNYPGPGLQCSFVRGADGWPNYGSVLHVGGRGGSDAGGDFQIFAGHGSGNGGNYLRFRNADNSASPTDAWTAWKTIWDSGNDGSGSGLDADLLDGYNASTSATANTVVVREGSGHIYGNYIFGTYFHASSGNSENPTIGQVWTQSTGDNYLRKSTPAHFKSQLGLWHTGNDGTGSGLDADLLDGQHGSYYANESARKSVPSSGNYQIDNSTAPATLGNGYLRHDFLNSSGPPGSSYRSVLSISSYTGGSQWTQLSFNYNQGINTPIYFRQNQYNGSTWGSWHQLWDSANDGSGSGLDADLLDGVHGASFLRSDVADTATQINSPIFSGNISTSGDGQNNYPFRLTSDYNSYMTATAGNTWGLFWAGNSGARYGTNGNGGPGNIWSNSGNPNEFVFVGGDSTKWTVSGNTGDTWQAGTARTSPQGILWGASNDGSGSGLDADLLDGLQLMGSTTNNQANKVMRTDANGYGNFGWIYTASGTATGSLARIYCSQDGYLRYLTPSSLGTSWLRENVYNNLIDSTGASANLNTVFNNNRSGNIDCWSGSNLPSGTSHVQGIQVRHSTGSHYGFQLVNQYSQDKIWHRRISNNSFSGWQQVWTSNSDGAGSGLDADLLDGYNAEETAVNNSIVKRDGNAMITAKKLYLNKGNYEGQIIFGASSTWRVGISQYDNADAEMRIWAKNGNGRVHIVTGFDGETSTSKPSDGLVVDHNNVGIGAFASSDPSEKLHVKGNILASGNITAYSDERLKSDIQTLDGKKVLQMRGVSFTKDGEASSGVIAQELEKIAPELVRDGEYKSVAYGNITGYLIEAIKEQSAQINAQQEQINQLTILVKSLTEK